MRTHTPNVHLHPTAGTVAREVATAGEAFLQEKEEERTKVRKRHGTSLDQVTTTPMGTAEAIKGTTTRDEREDGPQRPDAVRPAMRRCLPDIGEEREK